MAREFNFNKVDDFLAAIGRSDITPSQMVSAINDIVEAARPEAKDDDQLFTSPSTATSTPTGIRIQGVGNLLTNLAHAAGLCRATMRLLVLSLVAAG